MSIPSFLTPTDPRGPSPSGEPIEGSAVGSPVGESIYEKEADEAPYASLDMNAYDRERNHDDGSRDMVGSPLMRRLAGHVGQSMTLPSCAYCGNSEPRRSPCCYGYVADRYLGYARDGQARMPAPAEVRRMRALVDEATS